MSLMSSCSRKRPRSCEDYACELMPISKRINDLHIRSGFPENDASGSGSETNAQAQNPNAKCNSVNMTDLTRESFEKGSFCNNYQPDLNVSQNPYYYHVNEVLFQAHVHRVQRMSRAMS